MYEVKINTDSYRPLTVTDKHQENGTINDFMKAINNWSCNENSARDVRYRLMLFAGNRCYGADGFTEWYSEKGQIVYYDNNYNCNRVDIVSPYGHKPTYIDTNALLRELETNGKIRIQFRTVYDTRQYRENFDNCFMEITKK